jgi:choline transport protein
MFDLASIAELTASVAVQLYAVYHEIDVQPWHIYVAYILISLVCVAFCIFYNRFIPKLQDFGLFLIVGGGIITIIVLAAYPKEKGYATTSQVFKNWDNQTGWNDGVCFLTG